MKKMFTLVLVFTMLISLVGCGTTKQADTETTTETKNISFFIDLSFIIFLNSDIPQ